jgi:iron(III) transport system permease protein
MARSLGCRPAAAFARVTLPLMLPGIAAALCLVFLSSVTELTATLILVPTGVQTLATQFWAYQTNTAYGAAAPYAVAILILAAVPNLAVAAWFARRRATTGRVSTP